MLESNERGRGELLGPDPSWGARATARAAQTFHHFCPVATVRNTDYENPSHDE